MRFAGYAKLDLGAQEGRAVFDFEADTFRDAASVIAARHPTCCAILRVEGKGVEPGTHVALHIRRGVLGHFGTTLGPLQ